MSARVSVVAVCAVTLCLFAAATVRAERPALSPERLQAEATHVDTGKGSSATCFIRISSAPSPSKGGCPVKI